MDLYVVSVAVLIGAMVAAVIIFCGYIITRQQRTIDRLTDKLMAKDYREYSQMSMPRSETPEKPRRRPMSFHDDPDIAIEEEING